MITKTFGKLHFDDLDHGRFELLILSLIYTNKRWNEIHHCGVVGNDDGIDIYATDILDNGKVRTWAIQCKRYQKFTAVNAKEAVKEIIDKNISIPDVVLLVVSCNTSKKTIETYKKFAIEQNISNPFIMTASNIEAELYNKRHDLLFAYFGIDLAFERRNRIETIKTRIRMKYSFTRAFRSEKIDFNNRHLGDTHKFSKLVIHSVDDNIYPEVYEQSFGISSWFVVEPLDFYNNGIEVIIGFAKGIIYNDLSWEIINSQDLMSDAKSNLLIIGRIPYNNIIAYDIEGDNYYGDPHIYCDFSCNGMPYEEIVYHPHRDERFRISKYLDNKRKIERNV